MKKKMSFSLRTLYLKGRCLEQAQSSVLDAAMETGSGPLKAKKKTDLIWELVRVFCREVHNS